MSAPTPTKNGTAGAYEQPQERGQDSSGPYLIRRFEGTRNEMRAKELALGSAFYVYRESFTGGKDAIEVRYAGGTVPGIEVPQIVWEIRWSPVEKDILRSDAARGLTDFEKKVLRSYIADPSKFEFKDPAITSDFGLQFVALIKSGETSVRQFVPTLTRTITMATPELAFISSQFIGRIFRTNSLFGSEGLLPDDFVFPLPNDPDPIPTADDVRILRYGWQKTQLDGTRAAYQKTSIVQAYEYGLWPQAIYGVPL